MPPRSEQKVESVERALTILSAFSNGSKRLTLGELTERTGFYRSTILRLAASLERFGYLHRDTEGYFRLGPALFSLGALYQQSFDLGDLVRPALDRLVQESHETAAFYVRDGARRICLFRQHSQRVFRLHLEEGAALPLDRGASARILMAFSGEPGEFYDKVRRNGYYISEGERDPETLAFAVPVLGIDDRLVGSLGIIRQISQVGAKDQEEALNILRRIGRELSIRLGMSARNPLGLFK